MRKYIDAENLKRRMLKASLTGVNLNKGFEGIIDMMPPADVRDDVKGSWKEVEKLAIISISTHYRCNMCGRLANDSYDYCPHCGSDMRERDCDGIH